RRGGPSRGRRRGRRGHHAGREAYVSEPLQISEEVADALANGRPVVALETSIVGQGLPPPHNLRAALECEAAIRHEGGVPATVAVFGAGATIILDLPVTLERLESLSVPVLGYVCDEFPAFYTRHSGCPVSARVDTPEETARVIEASWATGTRGLVIAVPPPAELEDAERLVELAVKELTGVSGPEVTPRLLARVAEL